jgi:hypothetical protein
MVSIIEEVHTAHTAFEALRAHHLVHAASMRSALLAQVTATKQNVRRSARNHVAVGRHYVLHLRNASVESAANPLLP